MIRTIRFAAVGLVGTAAALTPTGQILLLVLALGLLALLATLLFAPSDRPMKRFIMLVNALRGRSSK
jgi:hypothetical protein